MRRGEVSHWSGRHGYGFITPLDGGDDLFFHATGVVQPTGCLFLTVSQLVEFETGTSKRGPVAFNVRPLKPEDLETTPETRASNLLITEIETPAAGHVAVVGL